MFGFERDPNESARRERFAEMARKSPKGMGIEQLVPGAVVMVSPEKLIGDRSWCGDFYEIIGVAGSNVLCKLLAPPRSYAGTVTMQFAEREWYAAEHLYEDWRKANAEVEAAWLAHSKAARDAAAPEAR